MILHAPPTRSTPVRKIFASTVLALLGMAIPALGEEAVTGRLSDKQLNARIDESRSIRLEFDAKTSEPKVIFEDDSRKYEPGLRFRDGQNVIFQWLPDQKVLWVASPKEIRKLDFSQEGSTTGERYVTDDFHPDASVPDWFARAVKELK